MFLSDTNLRYLFVIDDIARKKAAVSSMEVARALGVSTGKKQGGGKGDG